ncbi:1-deoxy-D-xylulose 5-phosphate reductoisomerase, partial [Frankliniella fusca]
SGERSDIKILKRYTVSHIVVEDGALVVPFRRLACGREVAKWVYWAHTSRSALEWSGKQAVIVEDMRLGVACRWPGQGRAPTGRVLNLLEMADKTIGTPMEYTGR